jgi:hypothetical protein
MTTSIYLGIPYIDTNQSQPDVTHNDALVMIQVLLANGVWQIGLNTPPSSPVNGDAYVIGTSPSGIWVGKDNCIAAYYQDQWYYIPGFDSDGTQIEMTELQVGLMVYSKADKDFFIWEDNGSPSVLAWNATGLGAGTIGVAVEDEGSSVLAEATTLNFVGDAVTVTTPGGSEATVTITSGLSGIEVSDGGSPQVVSTATAIDFVGTAVASVVDSGGGLATVTINQAAGGGISGVEVGDGGSPQTVTDATALDFVGAGVTVADSGGGLATVTIDAPYDFGVFYSGVPGNSQEIFRMEAVRAFTIADGAPGSTANARVESTGSAVFSIRKNGVQFATVTWSAGSPTNYDGTWAFDTAADESFVAGDVLTMVGPSTADTTLEDIAIFVKGSRD